MRCTRNISITLQGCLGLLNLKSVLCSSVLSLVNYLFFIDKLLLNIQTKFGSYRKKQVKNVGYLFSYFVGDFSVLVNIHARYLSARIDKFPHLFYQKKEPFMK